MSEGTKEIKIEKGIYNIYPPKSRSFVCDSFTDENGKTYERNVIIVCTHMRISDRGVDYTYGCNLGKGCYYSSCWYSTKSIVSEEQEKRIDRVINSKKL
jgi:hypothetical protein